MSPFSPEVLIDIHPVTLTLLALASFLGGVHQLQKIWNAIAILCVVSSLSVHVTCRQSLAAYACWAILAGVLFLTVRFLSSDGMAYLERRSPYGARTGRG